MSKRLNFKALRRPIAIVLLAVFLSTSVISSTIQVRAAAAVPAAGGLTELLTLLGVLLGMSSNEISESNEYRPPISFFEAGGTKPAPSLTIDDMTLLCGNEKWQLTAEYTKELQEILDSNVLSEQGRKEKLKELLGNAEKQAPTYSVLGELFRTVAEGKNEITKKK